MCKVRVSMCLVPGGATPLQQKNACTSFQVAGGGGGAADFSLLAPRTVEHFSASCNTSQNQIFVGHL